MSHPTENAVRNGRIGAAALLVFAAIYGVAGSSIEYSFSSDPLGPRVFPVALAVVLAVLALIYALKPGASEEWPRGRALLGAIAIPGLIAIATLILEPLGFPIAILILTAGVGRVFGASWGRAVGAGIVHAALWYLVFGYLLEVYLPLGSILGH